MNSRINVYLFPFLSRSSSASWGTLNEKTKGLECKPSNYLKRPLQGCVERDQSKN